MNTVALPNEPALLHRRKYRDNFARHCLGVSLYLQSEVMNVLTLKHGHSQLRINFEPYISLAGQKGARLSDIADALGISRQAANQVANQIETAGYLQRTPDPMDGRAKLLTTTPRANAMLRQGSREAVKLQARFADVVGERKLARVTATIFRLNRELGLLYAFDENVTHVLAGVLPRLADYISQRLQHLTMSKGHPGLKRSFGAVLTAIGPHGGRIQQMANTRDVSKQAISAIASELENLGYIERSPDPDDARQVVLNFTAAGRQLIADSVASVGELERELAQLVGEKAFAEVTGTMSRLYRSLHLEEDVFGHADGNDIRVIARQLSRQLGDEGARALARLILSGES